jgi:predicted MFS family arabinose efflux permease
MVTLLATAGFVSLASTRLCDAMLPALSLVFGTSMVEASAVISAYAIAYGLMQLVYGPLGDRYGKLRVIALACAASTCATVVAALAPNFATLVVARAAMGATAAAIFPMGLAWISDTVPVAQRQQVLARYSGTTVFGMVLGPLLGGFLTQVWSWRAAFVAVALMLGSVGCLIARQSAGETTQPAMRTGNARSLYGDPWSRLVIGAACIEAALGIGCLALVPTALHQRFGLPVGEAGAVVAAFGMGGFLFSRCAATMLRLVPRALLPALGGGILAAAFSLLAFLPHWGWAVLACAMAGFGFFTLHNTLQVQATQLAPQSNGLALGAFTASIFVGQSAGVSLAVFTAAKLGAEWVFATTAVGFLVLGTVMTTVLKRRLSESHLG